MALLGSNVRLPTRTGAFRSQQPKPAVSRPNLNSSMYGSSFTSMSNTLAMPSSSSRTANRRVVTMAAKVTGKIKLELVAGKANPSPPVGPALGAKGVNIMAFCKEYNAQTAKMAGDIVPVEITVYEVRSCRAESCTGPSRDLLLGSYSCRQCQSLLQQMLQWQGGKHEAVALQSQF
eukprot:GHUV01006531.1.p1 GENE.GHUV01006531.1~~GHUV01006531.1.p1  ORF type:complete len:176 (+),score=53.88 GHUV01006531.1:112-639(+)